MSSPVWCNIYQKSFWSNIFNARIVTHHVCSEICNEKNDNWLCIVLFIYAIAIQDTCMNKHSVKQGFIFFREFIRYAKAYSSYECFILRFARHSSKLLGQGYVTERLKSSLRKFYGRYGDLIKHYEVSLSQMLHDMTIDNDTLNWSGITSICELITELDLITDFDLITKFWRFP